MLAPAALSLLATTFTDPKERGKAFGIYGSVAAGGGAVGLLLGGVLTSYLSWRWCLYINLFFAALAIAGAVAFLHGRQEPRSAQLDIPGVLLVSSGVFCLVYGFSNAATHSWGTPSTYGFLAAAVVLLAAFAFWMGRAKHPLLPPRVVLDRNRGAAYLGILIAGAGMFGVFLFVTYYLQDTLHYSPVITGVAFLPMVACIALASNVSNIVLMPSIGPKPIVSAGLLLAAVGIVLFTRIGVHSTYAGTVLPAADGHRPRHGPDVLHGVQHRHLRGGAAGRGRGVGHGQHRPAARRLDRHLAAQHDLRLRDDQLPRQPPGAAQRPAVVGSVTATATVHGYIVAFWWVAGIFLFGAIVCGALMRRGPLQAAPRGPGGPGHLGRGRGQVSAPPRPLPA